jgi:Asp-tRNA(Asn)/Glu-tRNA(Gln) amidotransferase C subunit
MGLIDDKGAASILKWLDNGKKFEPKIVEINTEKLPLELKVRNDNEEATLMMILMRNGIKFNITKFSDN